MIHNVHERTVAGTPEEVWAQLERLGGDDDPLWPEVSGVDFQLPEGLRPGAPVVHGPMRYAVDEVDPGRRLSFGPPTGETSGMRVSHGFTLTPTGDDTLVRHELVAGGLRFRLLWVLFLRRKHDLTLEALLDRLQQLTAKA